MCCGGGGGETADRRGSEFNVDWKEVDCGVSVGSEARAESVRASARAALVSIWVLLSIWVPSARLGASFGVALGWDRGCGGGGVILSCRAAGVGVGVGAAAGRQAGSSVVVVSMGVSGGGAEADGRRRRLAAWAPSAEGASGAPWTGMARRARTLLGSSCSSG